MTEPMTPKPELKPCPDCNGSGTRFNDECGACQGSGLVPVETPGQWLDEFLDSYPMVGGVAKPMTKREKALVRYTFANAARLYAKPSAPAPPAVCEACEWEAAGIMALNSPHTCKPSGA